MNLNCLKFGAEYTGTIKKLLERGYDFGDKLTVAINTAAFYDEINNRIQNSASEEDRLYKSCSNIANIVKYVDNKYQRLNWYCKIFGIILPDNPYKLLYDDKSEDDIVEGTAIFVDDYTDQARYESVVFNNNMTYGQMIETLEHMFKGIYYKPDGIRFTQIKHYHLTSYHYNGMIYTVKEEIK